MRAREEHLLLAGEAFERMGAKVYRVDRGGDVTYHGPGQLVGYPILNLKLWNEGALWYVRTLEAALIDALAELGLAAHRVDGRPGVWVGSQKVAAIGVRVSRGVTSHGFALNVDPDLAFFSHIVPCGLADAGVTSLRRLLGRPVSVEEAADAVETALARRFGLEMVEGRLEEAVEERDASSLIRHRLPPWLKVRFPAGERYSHIKGLLRQHQLHTVCEEARCPNIGECFNGGTATFMILGDVCTRACGFCAVTSGRPGAVDHLEPYRLARAVSLLGLDYAVITSVNRDDLPDGGASVFAACIRAIRHARPSCRVEVLIPDFLGDWNALETVVAAEPFVLNHNVETVPSLYRRVRPRGRYERSLELLGRVKELDPAMLTKSGLMVGLGETQEEVLQVMADLRAHGCDLLTIGQYLRPTAKHLPVERFYPPEEFEPFVERGRELGFRHVEAGPLVRSSYQAHRQALPAASLGR